MLKNNIISLIIHVFVGFATNFICRVIIILALITNIINNKMMVYIISIATFFISLVLYFILGKCFLKPLNTLKNAFSVSGVAIIGIISWIISYNLSPEIRYENILSWVLYFTYNMYLMPLRETIGIGSPVIAMICTVIPSLLMWCGIQYKKNRYI